MTIETKYSIGIPIYTITKFNKEYFYTSELEAYIDSIVYDNSGVFYKLKFNDSNYSIFYIEENKIDDLENGYYFTSKKLASKACELANS